VTTFPVSESTTVEATSRSADIIPFPTRPTPAEPTPEERLNRALASLNAALQEQKVAVAAWRDVLAELRVSTSSLQDSLQRYRSNLLTLGTSVSSLHAKAKSLEAWADGVTSTAE
jgi:chromosome segregation ATPase